MLQQFLAELFVRLGKDNPTFFKYIQAIALVIGGISIALSALDKGHCLLPAWLIWLEDKAVWIGSVSAALTAQLPKKDVQPQ
jgi:hypothetical protein